MDLLLSKYVSFIHKIPVDQYHNSKSLTLLADRFGVFSKAGRPYHRQELFRKNLNQIQVRFLAGRRPHGLIKFAGQAIQPVYSGQLWRDMLLRRPQQHTYFQQRETRQYCRLAKPHLFLAARQTNQVDAMLDLAGRFQHGEARRQKTKAERDHRSRCQQAHGWFWYRIGDALGLHKPSVLRSLLDTGVFHGR